MQFSFVFLLQFIFFNCNATASLAPVYAEVNLDLGEDHRVEIKKWAEHDKIWIEKKQIVSVSQSKNIILLKSKKVGTSYVRIGSYLRQINVSPVGTRVAELQWKQFKKAPTQIQMERCQTSICLKGEIHEFSEYKALISFFQKSPVPLRVQIQMKDEIKNQIKSHMTQHFREQGLLPSKIVLDGVWRTYFHPKKMRTEIMNVGQSLGLTILTQDQIIQMEDSVAVSVKIVEINKSLVQKIGVTWPDQYSAQIVTPFSLKGPSSFEVFLSAAENTGQAKILSSPQLIGRSGEEAQFFAGGEFPVKIHGQRSYQVIWKKYGIGLKLRPLIDALGQLSLKIETEVSSVDHSLQVDDLPAINVSRVSSQFDTINQKTVALSGLIKNENSQNSSGLPYLKNIPLLGALFRSEDFIQNKTELVVFVTPRILTPEDEPSTNANP